MWQLLLCILKDMREPLVYLPQGAVLGTAGWLLAGVLSGGAGDGRSSRRKKKRELGRIAFGLSIAYFTIMLQFAFLSRAPGSRTGLSLRLFETWGSTVHSRALVLENILMFIPFGILVPVWLRPLRRGWLCVASGILCSVGLEYFQWLTQRGHCQLDDVVMNGLGVLLGWLLTHGHRAGSISKIV